MRVTNMLNDSASNAHSATKGTLNFVATIWRCFQLSPGSRRRILNNWFEVDFVRDFGLINKIFIVKFGIVLIQFSLFRWRLVAVFWRIKITLEIIAFW